MKDICQLSDKVFKCVDGSEVSGPVLRGKDWVISTTTDTRPGVLSIFRPVGLFSSVKYSDVVETFEEILAQETQLSWATLDGAFPRRVMNVATDLVVIPEFEYPFLLLGDIDPADGWEFGEVT